jgi:hypothetical protein
MISMGFYEHLFLFIVLHAAQYGLNSNMGVFSDVAGILFNLQYQFPCGGDNQDPGRSLGALSFKRVLEQMRINIDEKSGALSGSRLRLSGDIRSGKAFGRISA